MAIVQAGAVNFGAQIVPNVFVNIIPPAVAFLNGVPTNIAGVVGSAAWGPVNKSTLVSDYRSYQRAFADLVARKYDMGTTVAVAILQGASNFRCVRVTDGTDTAASGQLVINGNNLLTLVGKYTGSFGNKITAYYSDGTAAGTSRITISAPGQQQEVFDNIAGVGATRWLNVQAAINAGAGQSRGPSNLVIAAVPGAVVPAVGTTAAVTLTNGTDGAAALTDAMLLGADGSPRTGLYALRNAGCSVATVTDYSTLANFSTIVAFAESEGVYMLGADAPGMCAAGNTGAIGASSTAVASDSRWAKMLAGDWIFWNDPITQQLRLVSPCGFYLGLLANLSPEQSGLNKPMYGIAGTQTTFAGGEYSDAELTVIAQARFDVICQPSVGGNYYSSRLGINLSSDATSHGDNYPRLTAYIARTFNAALGKWVGQLQTPAQRRAAKAQADGFFQNMQTLGQIGNAEGTTPFKVVLDISNNPPSQVALGYETADATVQYLSVIEKFILNLQGGQSVQIVNSAASVPSSVAA